MEKFSSKPRQSRVAGAGPEEQADPWAELEGGFSLGLKRTGLDDILASMRPLQEDDQFEVRVGRGAATAAIAARRGQIEGEAAYEQRSPGAQVQLEAPAAATKDELRTKLKGPREIQELGNQAFSKGEYYRALDFYNQAIVRLETLGESEEDRRSGCRAGLHYDRARCYYRVEDFWRSTEEAGACLAADPEHKRARAILEELAPNLAEAIDDDRAREHRLANAAPLMENQEQEQEQDNRSSTHRLMMGVLRMKEEGNRLFTKGDAVQAAEVYSGALRRLEEVRHELDGSDCTSLKATLLANRSQAYLTLKRWEEALADAEASLQAQPNNAKALHRREQAQQSLTAVRQRRAHGEALKNALSFKLAGNKHLAEGDARAAAEAYGSGLDWLVDLPEDPDTYDVRAALFANRALAHLRRKLWKEALQDADAALEADSSHTKARFRRAQALVELHRLSEAVQELELLRDGEPANSEVKYLLEAARAQLSKEVASPLDQQIIEPPPRPEALGRLREGDILTVCVDFFSEHGGGEFVRGQTGTVVRVQDGGGVLLDIKDGLRSLRCYELVHFCRARRRETERTPQMEVRRLLRESEAAYDVGRYAEALDLAIGAVGLAEAEMEDASVAAPELLPQPPRFPRPALVPTSDVAEAEVTRLLLAYAQEVRCRLAQRDLPAAGETARRATQLYEWGLQRLPAETRAASLRQYRMPSLAEFLVGVARAAAGLAEGTHALEAGRASEARASAGVALRLLEAGAWDTTGPLRAALLALRGEAAAAEGEISDAWVDAEGAAALDARCARAQALVTRLCADEGRQHRKKRYRASRLR